MEIDQATLTAQDIAEPAAPEPSMADTMRATLDSIKERNAAPDEPVAKADRVRAADGKFAKVDAVPDTAVNEAPEAGKSQPEPAKPVGTESAEASAAPAPEQPASTVRPPASWTAAAKAEFEKASPVIQQEVLRREQQMHDGIAQYKEAAQYAQVLHKAIAPYENTIKQWGTTPDGAIRALFEADRKLSTGSPAEKVQAFAELAKGYGIDLSNGLPQQAPIDPNFHYLQTELQSTKQQLNQVLSAQQQREQAELNSVLEQAKQGKPHFDSLGREIGALLQASIDRGQPITIDQAYEAALYASPSHRQELLTKQLDEKLAEEAKRRADEAAKAQAAAQAAKAASATNVARRGTLPAQKPVGTMQDTMRETLESIRSR